MMNWKSLTAFGPPDFDSASFKHAVQIQDTIYFYGWLFCAFHMVSVWALCSRNSLAGLNEIDKK